MIATTTISSIRVNPRICVFIVVAPSVFSLSARVRASSRGGGAARGRPEFGAVGVAFTAILDGERTRADGRKSTGHVDLRRHAAGDTHATQRTHVPVRVRDRTAVAERSEEHTSELQSLMRISYAVFCLKKKTYQKPTNHINH